MSEKKVTTATQSSVSRTTDPPQSVLLRLRRTKDGFLVTDTVGVRYGVGESVGGALHMWAEDVDWLLVEDSRRLGGPLLAEQSAYRGALDTDDAQASSPKTGSVVVPPEEK